MQGVFCLYMHDTLPRIRCPACHSELVSPIHEGDLWECRYHLCRAVFAVYARGAPDQAPLVQEDGDFYPAGK